MSSMDFEVPTSWHEDGRITASGETDIYIPNTSTQKLYWWITDDDTPPSIDVNAGNPLHAAKRSPFQKLDSISMTLADGERLWVATVGSTVTVPKTEG